MILSLI